MSTEISFKKVKKRSIRQRFSEEEDDEDIDTQNSDDLR